MKDSFPFIYVWPFVQGMGVENSVICNRYMVVFQYGSAVLFNVEDHEIDFFLNIARKHASGLLPEMRKDGNFFLRISILYSYLE